MIEEGKRYIMRGGEITGKIYPNEEYDLLSVYPWTDGVATWSSRGKYIGDKTDSPFDIIREATPIEILSQKFGI